jgi:heme exporter protein CcmD
MSSGEVGSAGSYALYLWASYGLTALLLAFEAVMLVKRSRAVRRRLHEIQAMEGD